MTLQCQNSKHYNMYINGQLQQSIITVEYKAASYELNVNVDYGEYKNIHIK
jgi:hypothetical protein